MAQLTHEQYDALERAIIEGRRIAIYRRGTEYVVTPRSLLLREGREVIEANHPTTGESMSFFIDQVDTIQVIA
ncbi:MAG: hypothetical protein ACREON_12150 [Gemmatimonadaceae bacterium]